MATKKTTTAKRKTLTVKKSAKKMEVGIESKLSDAADDIVETAEELTDQAESVIASVSARLNKNISTAQNTARQLWFANLGIYGRLYEEVQVRTSRVSKEAQDLVDDLVSRGEKVQDEAKSLLQEGRSNIEEQVEQARDRITKINPITEVKVGLVRISDRLEALRKNYIKAA